MKIPKTESKTVEFKKTFNQEAIESLVAFANTDGGSVYVGVRDDGKVLGVQLANESETTWINEIKSKTAPAIVPEADRLVVGGKSVVRLYIAPLPVKPTSVQGHYYIRKGKSNHLMSISELSDMYLRSMSSSWDAMPSEHSPEDISLEKVAAFAKRMNPDSPDDPMRVLRKLSLVKDGKPTNACYLAFAKDDVPSTLFQAGRFKADSVIIDSKAFKLDLFGELDNAMEFVRKHLMNGIVITGKPQHDIKHDYPEEAIREIVLNMLVHRDYLDHGGVSIIKIFDDRMEFTNPGGLSGGLTVADLLADRYATKARNPEIAELFRCAGLTERYGSGIKRIMNACKSHGYVDVEFQNLESWFRVILRKTGDGDFTKPLGKADVGKALQKGSQKGSQKSSQKSSQKILEAILANNAITTMELAELIGISQRAIAKHMATLQSSGRVRRVGPDKGGHWEVVDV